MSPRRRTHRQAARDPRVHRRAASATAAFPPSVREIGEAVGLTSSSTVHAHLATLQRQGYLRRDPTKPRAIEVRYDVSLRVARPSAGPTRHVPLVGDVAAGTDVLAQENVEELLPMPADFTGDGQLFMLRVRGDSMIDAGILDGDYVVARAPAAGREGRHRRGRHPRRRGHGQDLHAARATRSCCSRPTPGCRPWSSTPATSPSTARSSPSCAASRAAPTAQAPPSTSGGQEPGHGRRSPAAAGMSSSSSFGFDLAD